MQHWPPDSTPPRDTDAPADVWTAWLTRAPLDHVVPPPPDARGWAGPAMLIALAAFWSGAAALGWLLLA